MNKTKIILSIIAVVFLAGVGYFSLSGQILNNFPFAAVFTSQQTPKIAPAQIQDWGTVSSKIGFSVQYPYKQIGAIFGNTGVFSVAFLLHPSLVFSDASSTEKVSEMMTDSMLFGNFDIAVIQDTSKGSDLAIWAKAFIKKSDTDNNTGIKTLSEKITQATIGGIKGYQLTDTVEESKDNTKLDYIRNGIFARKNGYIYYANYLSPASDTPALLTTYLKQTASSSIAVLNTLRFDHSTTTAIIIPRSVQAALSGIAKTQRDNLLATLRTEPYFDTNMSYPASTDSECASSTIIGTTTANIYTDGLYISVDNSVADTDIYDTKGNHTGFLPPIPGFPNSPTDERISEVSLDSYGADNLFTITNLFDGRIQITGKKYGMANIRIATDGNACTILNTYLPTTPYSIATIPITARGDIGPISYDIDGDGKQDFVISIIHPLLPEKQKQIEAVMMDMQLQDGLGK